MWRPEPIKPVEPVKAERQVSSGSWRNRLTVLLALVTAVCLGSALFLSKGTQLLMPGPLTSVHGAIENCNACHTKIGTSKLSWVHGLVAGDPLADSKACITCHKMPDTAFNAHSASAAVLKNSTKRLTKIAAAAIAPQSARAQNIAFPMREVMAGDLYCATCHQEHQGESFKLNRISNEQCRSCHVLKFDSFDGNHPKFENFPFKRRTRVIFDHAGHFGKHYPEMAKKDPAKRIPDTCSTCHNSEKDRRVMAVVPFEQNCSVCHLDQIIGKERASGPKGIAFLALPGLDLETLKQKNALIGEWPEASEAALTPFMKVMISRNEQGRALVEAVDSLNLQDLSGASDDQIKAVTSLVWEIKGLFHKLIEGKASDVLGDLNIGGGVKLSASLVADLTASLPRDVVISAQQQWLPNLDAETANGPGTGNQEQSGGSAVTAESEPAESASPEEPSGLDTSEANPIPSPNAAGSEVVAETETAVAEPDGSAEPDGAAGADSGKETTCTDQPPVSEKVAQVEDTSVETGTVEAAPGSGEEALAADGQGVEAVEGRLPLQNGTPRAIKARIEDTGKGAEPEGVDGESDAAEAKPAGGKKTLCSDQPPPAEKVAQVEEAAGEIETAKTETAKAETDGGNEAPSAAEQPDNAAGDQSDDLLFPTQEELGASKTGITDAEKASQPEEAGAVSKVDKTASAEAPPESKTDAAKPLAQAAPVVSIRSDVDPESWAEYGGWYPQDYAIFYRPTGHKDKLIYSWLILTGPQAPKGAKSPAAAVFDVLTSKDAQGSCTKCHSVDDSSGKARAINFSPASVESKKGRFTNFIHEPHFGIMNDRGCLTCHNLEKDRPYLSSYEQGNPLKFVASFGAVKKELCQTCHTSGAARQDCLLCHKYHVNGVITPIMNTKIPAQ